MRRSRSFPSNASIAHVAATMDNTNGINVDNSESCTEPLSTGLPRAMNPFLFL
jgi:hypothetical protein